MGPRRRSVLIVCAASVFVATGCPPQSTDPSGSTSTTTVPATTSTTTTTTTPAGSTYFEIDSDPDNPIGRGIDQSWLVADAAITPRTGDGGRIARLSLSLPTPPSWNFTLSFRPPDGELLVPGSYEGAMDATRPSPPRPGINVNGGPYAIGCASAGRFDILQVEWGADGVLSRLSADFVQSCPAVAPGELRGRIRYRAASPFPVPSDRDVDGIPDTADNCDDVANPAQTDTDRDATGDACDPAVTNTWLRFDPDPGEFVSGGQAGVWYSADGAFTGTVIWSGRRAQIDYDDGHRWWTVAIAAPSGSVEVGTYTSGVYVYGSGRGCGDGGTAVVHEIAYSNPSTISRMSADFAFRCDGTGPVLRGSVRYNATDP